jgi:hypothetical protein
VSNRADTGDAIASFTTTFGPVLLLAAASRLLAISLVGLAAAMPDAHITWVTGNPWVAWDGWWYVHVAANGYHATPVLTASEYDVAFFPLWPGIIRVASLGVFSLDWTAVVLGNLLFLLAAALVYRVMVARFGPSVATGGVALWSFAPPAFTSSLAYAEPVFVTLAAAYFLQRSPARQVALGAFAMLSRLTGLALIPAALFQPRRRWLAIVPFVVFAGWWAWLAWMSGDPFMYWKGTPSWYGSDAHGLPAIWHALLQLDFFYITVFAFLALTIVGSLRILRSEPALAVFALGCIAMTMITAIPESMPRHAWSGFPAFAGLALIAQGWKRTALLGFFLVGQAILVVASVWRGITP